MSIYDNFNFYDKLLKLAQKNLVETYICEKCGRFPPTKIPEFGDLLAVCQSCYDEIEREAEAKLAEEQAHIYCFSCGKPINYNEVVTFPSLCHNCLWDQK